MPCDRVTVELKKIKTVVDKSSGTKQTESLLTFLHKASS